MIECEIEEAVFQGVDPPKKALCPGTVFLKKGPTKERKKTAMTFSEQLAARIKPFAEISYTPSAICTARRTTPVS